jgi:hypothetical protein
MRLHKAVLVVAVVILSNARADQPSAEPDKADAFFKQLVAGKDWREQDRAAAMLADLGRAALPQILEGTKHTDSKIRRICLKLLRDHFPNDPAAFAVILGGLDDSTDGIAYECAFFLGKTGNKAAIQPLRKVISRKDNWERYAAAKSLAELGEKDVIRTLYWGLGDDSYMIRMMSNVGIKALTGKDLNDFSYEYGEGAFVSGGNEYRAALRPIHDAELKASRFQAVAKFCRWLQSEKPELYAILAPSRNALRKRILSSAPDKSQQSD